MKRITVKKLDTPTLPVFLKYVGEAFHEKYILQDTAYLKWQYDGLYVALVGEKIVGHLGFKDVWYKVYDMRQKVRVLMNLFVLEPYRTFGVGALLAREVCRTRHKVLVSGYTEGTKKLCQHFRSEWKDAGNLQRFIAILDEKTPLIREYIGRKTAHNLKRKIGAGNQTGDFIIVSPTEKATALNSAWRAARDRYAVTVERTDAYLKWRFLRNPLLRYDVITAREKNRYRGYLIYRFEECEGFKIARIVDIVASQSAEMSLFTAFLEKIRHDGAHIADFFFSGDLYKESLCRSGFFPTIGTALAKFPRLFNPVTRNGRTYINIGYDMHAPLKDCYFTKADGDQDRANPH